VLYLRQRIFGSGINSTWIMYHCRWLAPLLSMAMHTRGFGPDGGLKCLNNDGDPVDWWFSRSYSSLLLSNSSTHDDKTTNVLVSRVRVEHIHSMCRWVG
jgi:hypothetical protein